VQGSFRFSNPEFTSIMQRMRTICPSLFESIDNCGTSVDDDEENQQRVMEDEQHQKPAALVGISRDRVKALQDQLLQVVWPNRLQRDHAFVSGLRSAYENDYGMAGSVFLSNSGVQWSAKLAFTDP